MKKGFTLLELLVVIILIGFLLAIVVPFTIKILDGSVTNTMKIQEEEVENAAKIYLEDSCKTPLDNTKICTLNKSVTDGIVYYNGEISLSALINNNYIDQVSIRNKECEGRIVFTNNEPKAYLKCGDVYSTDGY